MLNITYGRQEITKEDLDAVVSTLQSDWLTQGPAVAAFEKEFAVYVGAQYAVAVSNGTTALHIAAQAMNVKPGSRVITTPITFVASANCICYCGGEPVFADIDEQTMVLDLNEVRKLLEDNPAGTFEGIIPVSFAGYPADMEAFRTLADEHGLWLIEDACHAPGASFTDSKGQTQLTGNGVFADLSIFSFHPVKHITTGEGGMITTNNKALYQKLLSLRSHGITRDPNQTMEYHGPWYYEMQELGYNYRIADMACALGSSQLKRAKPGVERRQAIAQIYTAAFRELPIQTPFVSTNVAHAYHLYIIQTPERKALYEYLKEQGISCQVHYVPVHTMPYYQKRGWEKGDFPKAEAYYEQCLSLPMYPTLTDNDLAQIINHIKNFFYAETSNNSSPGWEQKNRT
jgi:UDP-4-amino-4,6-dideoxy-N-acetyl-beta-L-altrosamine transaminase